jgi:hypothetical protein
VFGLPPLHVDVVDVGARRTGPAPLDQPFDGGPRALEHAFDRPVHPVTGPARDAQRPRLFAHAVAEEHALHAPSYDDVRAHDVYTWHEAQKKVERLL